MYDVYLVTKDVTDEDRLLEHIGDKGVFLTTYDTTTKHGKKEGTLLKNTVGAKLEPCIVVLKQDILKKCFYSEASKDVIGDFLNWFNDTKFTMKATGEVTIKKESLEERLQRAVTVPALYSGTDNLPEYATKNSAGMDLRANLEERVVLGPMQRVLIPTGLKIALPKGLEAQVRPRSGLALKHGITVLNTPGTIDADYRGEIGVILINLSDSAFEIKPGDKIAQLVTARYVTVNWKEVDELDSTERGEGGFGHTGI